MIDTIAITTSYQKPPSMEGLIERGWRKSHPYRKSRLNTLTFYSDGVKYSPRLTFSQTPNYLWHLTAEVSLPAWINGSNLELFDESKIDEGLWFVSEYVTEMSGMKFDAKEGRVNRVDFAKDFQIGERDIRKVIGKISKIKVPRYNRTSINDETVYFQNKGKRQSKKIRIYDKHAEILQKDSTVEDKEKSRGVLRVETLMRTSAIEIQRKKMGLPNRTANMVLTKEFADVVINETIGTLHSDTWLSNENIDINRLLEAYDAKQVIRFIGFAEFRREFGNDFYRIPSLKFNKKTYDRYLTGLQKVGIIL